MSHWKARAHRACGLTLIALGIVALFELKHAGQESESPCEDNAEFFLAGTFDDCAARSPIAVSGIEDRGLHAYVQSEP